MLLNQDSPTETGIIRPLQTVCVKTLIKYLVNFIGQSVSKSVLYDLVIR